MIEEERRWIEEDEEEQKGEEGNYRTEGKIDLKERKRRREGEKKRRVRGEEERRRR